MKTLFKTVLTLLALIMLMACNIEPIKTNQSLEAQTEQFARYKPDPAINNKKKVIFTETVDGTYEEKLASMVITSSHPKPVSLNWDLGDKYRIVRVILINDTGSWMAQTSTSGWRGFWVSYLIEKDKPYTLFFQNLDIKVDFVWTGKI